MQIVPTSLVQIQILNRDSVDPIANAKSRYQRLYGDISPNAHGVFKQLPPKWFFGERRDLFVPSRIQIGQFECGHFTMKTLNEIP